MFRLFGLTAACPALAFAFCVQGAGAQDAFFQDDFEGDLDPAWEVSNPNPDAFIVEDGILLALANSAGQITEGDIANTFSLTSGLPEGDWVMEIAFEAELQTAREEILIGVVDGTDRGVLASVYTGGDKYYGWNLSAHITKFGGGKKSSFRAGLAGLGCNVCGDDRQFPNFVATVAQPIVLQLEKTGRQYLARAKLGGPDDVWRETFKIADLRGPATPVLYVRQYEANGGESLFLIDYFKITAK